MEYNTRITTETIYKKIEMNIQMINQQNKLTKTTTKNTS